MTTVDTLQEQAPQSLPEKNGPQFRWRNALLGLAAIGIVVVALLAWWLGLFTAEPEVVSLGSTIETLQEDRDDTSEEAPTANGPSLASDALPPAAAEAPAAEDPGAEDPAAAQTESAQNRGVESTLSLAGTWSVVAGDATFVGYRADSQLGEAVGRSPGVTGTLQATETQIIAVAIAADMTQLESDSSLRDRHLGSDGIEHDTYPTSTFVLTAPIEVAAIPAEGVAVSFDAVGELTVRDVTQPVTITLDGTIVGDQLVVAGSSDIDLADFGASISGTTQATMEFSLVFG